MIRDYFELRIPNWQEIVSERIPERKIVNDLLRILRHKLEGNKGITVLKGVACEGKSTALLQTIYKLIKQESKYLIIQWQSPEFSELRETFELLSKSYEQRKKWLIFCDDPSRALIDKLFNLFSDKKFLKTINIQFLFCCRDTAWNDKWTNSEFKDKRPQIVPIEQLTVQEAEDIANEWETLGMLGKVTKDDFIKEILERNEQNKPAFLAGILLCKGKTLPEWIQEDRMKKILTDIDYKPQSESQNILKTYAYIIGMHKEGKENFDFLRQKVLAQAIGYDPKDLKKFRTDILTKLGNEIIFSHQDRNQPVYSRHRTIAEYVYDVLPEFGIDLEQDIYPPLATAAQQLVVTQDIPIEKHKSAEINRWQYDFPKYFAYHRKPPLKSLAILIAKALFKVSPENPYLITQLSRLYRDNKEFSIARAELRKNFLKDFNPPKDREYYHEWSLIERETEHYENAVWFCAISLADGIRGKLDHESLLMYLGDLAYAFFNLYDNNYGPQNIYLQAFNATTLLTNSIDSKVKFNSNEKQKHTLEQLRKNKNRLDGIDENSAKNFNKSGFWNPKISSLLIDIIKGINKSYVLVNHNNDDNEFVKELKKLHPLKFGKLEKTLGEIIKINPIKKLN